MGAGGDSNVGGRLAGQGAGQAGWTKTKLLILGRSDQGVNSQNTGQTRPFLPPTFIKRKVGGLDPVVFIAQR